jgi:hypothetical protein
MEKDRIAMNNDGNVTIKLSGAEALVLFELLTRWSEGQQDTIVVKHQAEQRVLWDIQCALESRLVEPISSDYHDHLSAAQQEVISDDQ